MTIKYALNRCLQFGLASFLSCGTVSILTVKTLAQQSNIVPDNTLGSESSQVISNFQGQSIERITGGATRGINLFHSFKEFNISADRAAYFFNSNSAIENILARVTGGNPSEILGKLGTSGSSNVNLFLMNPNGIVFGKDASLDVQGSFVGTTANGLAFGNQGVFSATTPTAPGLLTINPSALFFNQINQSAAIQNNSVASAGTSPVVVGFDALGLRVPDGKSLLLVGGNVSMDGGQLNAFGGRVELSGLASTGNIFLLFDENNLRLGFPDNVTRGTVTLTNSSGVFVTGAGGGDITINARNIEITGGSILSGGIGQGLGTSETVAGDITLNATGEIEVADFGSAIRNLVRKDSKGNGGNITIDAGSLKLRDRAELSASTYGKGDAGNVKVTATDAVSIANAGIYSTVEAEGVGKGGNIDITTGTLSLTEGAVPTFLRTSTFGKGDAGNVKVTATGAVSLAGGTIESTVDDDKGVSQAEGKGGNIDITAGTLSLTRGIYYRYIFDFGSIEEESEASLNASTSGKGDAGNVTVTAKDSVSLAGLNFGEGAISSRVGADGEGKGGNIYITTKTLSLTDRVVLETSTSGKGDAGNVKVTATGAVSLADNAYIFSSVEAGGVGKGGNIDITTGTLSLTDGAHLEAQTSGQGDAGNVTVTATDAVSLADNSYIFSTVEAGGVGKGGNIDIKAATLSLIKGAQLLTSSREASDGDPAGGGDAGSIYVKVTGAVDIAGTKDQFESGIRSGTSTGTVGNGGNITIDAGSFKLRDGALLNAPTENNNPGGNITVNANVFEILNGGQLIATTSSNGDAGKITVNAKNKVIISGSDPNYNLRVTNFPNAVSNIGANSGLFVSSTGSGTTGNIEVNSPKITLDNQGKLNAESASGNGGDITLNSDLLKLRHGSQISTTAGTASKGGNGGNININSKYIIAIPKENSDISANAYSGNGGKVEIVSKGIFGIESRPKPTEKSDITASSSQGGISGVININASDTSTIQNGLLELPAYAIDTNALIANSCISGGTKRQENSFTITGSGGLPNNRPGNVLISNYTTGEVRGVATTSRPWKKGDPIIEAKGVYRLSNGELLLSRECSN